jgi:hypothetical protein
MLFVAAVALPVAALLAAAAMPAVADDLPPDQERTVVFELFTPTETASGGG